MIKGALVLCKLINQSQGEAATEKRVSAETG